MTALTLYLAFGILNAVIAYDQKILMLATHGWSFEAVIEALLFVVLWWLQFCYWLGMKIWAAMDWCQAWIWGGR